VIWCCRHSWWCIADNIAHALRLRIGWLCDLHDRHITKCVYDEEET
jgi:hypothetical protein